MAWPKDWDMDVVLVPAAVRLDGLSTRLQAACGDHLRARIALPLVPPADWTRADQLTCTCVHCASLVRFLADPVERVWQLKAVQGDRSHVETTIANSRPDLSTATLRKGSPHTLVCTKNQASYDRRAAQRRNDLALLQQLLPNTDSALQPASRV